MSKIPVSLQLWSLRDLTKDDFAGTMRKVAEIGFKGVETAGYGNLTAPDAAKAIADAGLKVSGQHIGLGALRADLTKVAVEAHLLGTKHIVCPSSPRELFRSPASCAQIGEELDEIGAKLRGFGLEFHYHNHAFELVELDGRRGFDWLLDAASPRNLLCQADVYWVHTGNKNPAQFIREQGRRIKLLHVKDEKEIGLGPVNFQEVFAAAESIGSIEWYVVEVERYNHAPLESVRLSFEQLKKWGKA